VLPKVHRVKDASIEKYRTEQETLNIFYLKTIPPLTSLLSWKAQLSHLSTIAADNFYMESSIGRIGLSGVKSCIDLINVKETKLNRARV